MKMKLDYKKPKLICYGSIGDIVKAIGNMGKVADGGAGATQKTS